jgi:uncharacterized protein (DUF952 family)
MLIYKILRPTEWQLFEAAGEFTGSPVDVQDGYIHFSDRDQVAGTASKYFADEPDLVVAAVDTSRLSESFGDALRWEASASGGTYPHLYATLPRDAVVAVYRIAGASLVDDTLPR